MQHGIARDKKDRANGLLDDNLQNWFFVEGFRWAYFGWKVTPHGDGKHRHPTMDEGSSFIFIDGIPVCREGHAASCDHETTGSSFMFISD